MRIWANGLPTARNIRNQIGQGKSPGTIEVVYYLKGLMQTSNNELVEAKIIWSRLF